MGINPDVVGFVSDPAEVVWDSTDVLLYALGVGAGAADPVGFELEFTTENTAGVKQRVLPTFPVLFGMAPMRAAYARLGSFDRSLLVHGEQLIALHSRLPVEGKAAIQSTITGIYDKGSGAFVVCEMAGRNPEGELLFTLRSGAFIRGEGGWGGDRGPARPDGPPDRDPDVRVCYPTRRDQPLLYRLSGDRNPLHSDPEVARRAKYPGPILHGLCTYGFTGRALLHSLCGSDPDRFASMEGRFSNPVLPGDELTISIWDLGSGEACFRTANQTGVVVIDSGQFRYSV